MSWRSWSAVLAVLALAACTDSPDDTSTSTASTSAPTAAVSTVTQPATASTAPPTVPATAPTTAVTAPPTTGVAPQGFDRVAGRVTAADGSTCDVCLWLAATAEARAQGLMGVTDLSRADGMVFRWDEPTAGSFWMRDTPLPLSIAFFDADGTFVSAADMVPCLQPTTDAECARYGAAGPYTYAVEVAAGALPVLLMAPGSRLQLSELPCQGALGLAG